MTIQVAENVFTGEGDTTRLLAWKNRTDGRLRFPYPTGPEAAEFELVELSPRGTLWSWTVQRFRPKSPYDGRGGETDFEPYGVGYVELPGELIVEGRIVADHLESLTIGQPMRVTTEAYRETPAGEPVLTYAFTPDTGGHA